MRHGAAGETDRSGGVGHHQHPQLTLVAGGEQVRLSEGEAPSQMSFTVAVVARRLGVAPATLRTWERRYGLTPSGRSQGGHRRYSDLDIARLNVMRRLLLSGVTPAEAAAGALGVDLENQVAVDQCCQVAGDTKGSAKALSRSLLRAAMALDADGANSIVADSINKRGVIWTWDFVIVPVLIEVGNQWAETGQGIEIEHTLSEVLANQFARVVAKFPVRKDVPSVLLACAPDDLHCLPLRAIAAALAETNVSTQLLGPATPIDAVASAAARLGSPVVLVWAQLPATAKGVDWAAWPAAHQADARVRQPELVLAGPGWPDSRPLRAQRVHDLTETVATVRNALAA